ncbi:hypothetical protein PROFUN_06595 [Planoprotostelium fungivorum]|uniref:Uncharacterized protein n=1 Tax=Planoprotostelium fungivorum TaxID=1890364 RepID=A0A2P6MS07_9EUKA|nr:hypothetical protein PROFUN_06595 [Planoprotostelium fungivorum]
MLQAELLAYHSIWDTTYLRCSSNSGESVQDATFYSEMDNCSFTQPCCSPGGCYLHTASMSIERCQVDR